MPRRFRVHGLQKAPLNETAYVKLLKYYYGNDRNITVHFDDRIKTYAGHKYVARSKTHHIYISPKWCSYGPADDEERNFKKLTSFNHIERMEEKDIRARIIQATLHELKHCMQCDDNPIRYAKCNDDQHPNMKNSSIKYEFSPLEAEAEGWSLLHINRALERYESWDND